jgi:WD40 repeat protein
MDPVISQSVAFDPTGRFISTCGEIRDSRNGTIISECESTGTHNAKFTPSGDKLILSDGVLDVKSGRLMKFDTSQLRGSLSPEKEVDCSPDGRLAVCGNRLRRTSDWQPVDGPNTFKGAGAVLKDTSFSPDGRVLAVGFFDGSLGLWDTGTFQLVNSSPPVQDESCSVAFSPNGGLFAAGFSGGRLLLWKAQPR